MKKVPAKSRDNAVRSGVAHAANSRDARRERGSVDYEQRLSINREWARLDSSRHFEKDSEVFKTLRDITKRLDELGVPYAVAGALALFEHGVRRFTEDVDILVSSDGLKHIHNNLVGRGYRPKFEGARNLRDANTGVSIEFIIQGQYPGDGKPKPVAFPDPASVGQEIDGIKFLNLTALIELKLASGMTNPERAKDMVDVQEIVRTLALPSGYESRLDEFVQAKFREIWQVVNGTEQRFIRLWPKSLLGDKNVSSQIEQMKASGAAHDPDSRFSNDYLVLVTTDPTVARKYDMHDESEFMPDGDQL